MSGMFYSTVHMSYICVHRVIIKRSNRLAHAIFARRCIDGNAYLVTFAVRHLWTLAFALNA